MPLTGLFRFFHLKKPKTSGNGGLEVFSLAEQAKIFVEVVNLMRQWSVAVHDGQGQKLWVRLMLYPINNRMRNVVPSGIAADRAPSEVAAISRHSDLAGLDVTDEPCFVSTEFEIEVFRTAVEFIKIGINPGCSFVLFTTGTPQDVPV